MKNIKSKIFYFTSLILCSAFGPGYQPISIAPLITLIILIHMWRRPSTYTSTYTPLSSDTLQKSVLTLISSFIGSFLAYAGCFESTKQPDLSSEKTRAVIPYAFSFSCVMTACFIVDAVIVQPALLLISLRSRHRHRYSYNKYGGGGTWEVGLLDCCAGLPVIWTFVWSTVYHVSSTGDFGNWHVALSILGVDSLTCGVSWFFGSMAGGCYVLMVIALAIYHSLFTTIPSRCSLTEAEVEAAVNVKMSDNKEEKSTKYLVPIYAFLTLLMVIGSIISWPAGSFYQIPIGKYAPPLHLDVTCLTRGNFPSTISLLESSSHQLKRMPKMIMWSETSISTRNESETIRQALEISKKYWVILGVSYNEIISQPNPQSNPKYKYRNKFALVLPGLTADKMESRVGFIYQKTHTVPGVEDWTEPGNGQLGIVETAWNMTISAAICFDYNFPFINAQLQGKKVNLMLQPSATWGPIGPFHAFTNRLRSLDNQLTTIRCASNGVSGVYSDQYKIITEKITLGRGDSMQSQVPITNTPKSSLYLSSGSDWAWWASGIIVFGWGLTRSFW